jgi:hypothetical protein
MPVPSGYAGIKMSRAFPRILATELCRGPPKNFEIKFVLNNGRNKFFFSCPCGLRYFSKVKLKIKMSVKWPLDCSWVELYFCPLHWNGNGYFKMALISGYIYSPSVARGLRYFSTREINSLMFMYIHILSY